MKKEKTKVVKETKEEFEKDLANSREWYEDLASEIIYQAVHDYKKCLKDLKKLIGKNTMNFKMKSKYYDAKAMKAECEDFFRSGWLMLLTDIDGNSIIDSVREQVG
jgi:glucan-binding YG repeat protein